MMNLLSCRCDVCVNGPPQRQNLKEEACILLQTIGAHNVCRILSYLYYTNYTQFVLHKRKETDLPWMLIFQACRYSMDSSYNDDIHFDSKDRRLGLGLRPSLMMLVRSIREQVNLDIFISSHRIIVMVDALCCY